MSAALIFFGVVGLLAGLLSVFAAADANDDLLGIGGLFVTCIGILMLLGGMGVLKGDPECEDYGTVMVIIDDDKRCVPWELAPDLQDFPQP